MLTLNEKLTLSVIGGQLLVLVGQLVVFRQQRILMGRQLDVSGEAEKRAQRHDRLSVRPYLDFAGYQDPDRLDLKLINHSLGVANIESIEMHVGTHPIIVGGALDRGRKVLTALGLRTQHFDPRLPLPAVILPTEQTALGAGMHIQLIEFHFGRSFPAGDCQKQMRLIVHYSSLYGDRATATFDGPNA
jgi:hypothetical protein